MKVKQFVVDGSSIYSLDRGINEFIADKKVIDIKYGISSTTEFSIISALVMYEEN